MVCISFVVKHFLVGAVLWTATTRVGGRRDHYFVDINCDHHRAVLSAFQTGRRIVGSLHSVGYFRGIFELYDLVDESRLTQSNRNLERLRPKSFPRSSGVLF